ncbi:LIC11177 family protein [Leptospira ilyithenensis]|uniref:Uncharacterized protein n=1 Tax=Leptospira ilyithenensis TaxID=2484901 RepID=A0A4R9LTK2_9LEPT|nr:hypothetical protein [Leptospira ilyithenensis]TGN10493.1 hypothetical protein EHS11_09390 [Leptospira ilyithenensis]
MAENKNSTMSEVLKREKLRKEHKKEQVETERKAIEAAVAKMAPSATDEKPSIASAANSRRYLSSYEVAVIKTSKDLRYYFLLEEEYASKFKEIYQSNEETFKRYAIDGPKYLEYIRESYERYKKVHSLMPLEPMKPKYFKYVVDSIHELIHMLGQRFGS